MPERDRPLAVRIIGTAWIVIGGLTAVMALQAYWMGRNATPRTAERTGTLADLAQVLSWPVAHVEVAVPVLLVLGLLCVLVGARVLELDAWARRAAQVLAALLLLAVLALGGAWCLLLAGSLRTAELAGTGLILGILMGLIGLVLVAVLAAPFAAMLWHLRRSEVRAAFRA